MQSAKIGVEILNLDKKRPIFSPDAEIKIQWASDVRYSKSRIFMKEMGSGELQVIAQVPGHKNSFTIPPVQRDFGQSPLKILVEGYDADDKKLARGKTSPFFVTPSKAININELKDKLKAKQIREDKLNDKGFPERLPEKRKDIVNEFLEQRPPSTLFFPDYEFHSYLDIIKFVPQAAFYV